MTEPRWVHGRRNNRIFDTRQCGYCGSFACNGTAVACVLCGSVQCHGNGSGNGCCSICHYGYLPGWSRGYGYKQRVCAYKGCGREAVAACRKRAVCAGHAQRIKPGTWLTLAEYVADRVAHRDSGAGWEFWRLVA